MNRAIGRTSCFAKGVAHGGKIGQELLALAHQARAEGKISDVDWQKLPSTPEGMVNLLLSQDVEKRLIEALLETYG
jgi:hypothetical protein